MIFRKSLWRVRTHQKKSWTVYHLPDLLLTAELAACRRYKSLAALDLHHTPVPIFLKLASQSSFGVCCEKHTDRIQLRSCTCKEFYHTAEELVEEEAEDLVETSHLVFSCRFTNLRSHSSDV